MKKIVFAGFLLILLVDASGQYQKSNFLNKSGRTYDFGVTRRLFSGGRSDATGVIISYGRENSEKRLHTWFDTELVFGSNYTYNTVASFDASTPVTVTGKSGLSVAMRYNLAFFLTDNSSEETKLLPFLNIAAGYMTVGTFQEETYSPNTYPEKITSDERAGFTYGGGGGIIYRFTPSLGVRLSAAYYGVSQKNAGANVFSLITNYPAVTLALRYKILGDE
jgi:hypothetical protein